MMFRKMQSGRWLVCPEEWRRHRFTEEELMALCFGETVPFQVTYADRNVADQASVSLVPGVICGQPCDIMLPAGSLWSMQRWTGEGGPCDIPVRKYGFNDLTDEGMRALLSGLSWRLREGRAKEVTLFLQWTQFADSFFLSVRKWNDDALAASEQTRRTFFELARQAFDRPQEEWEKGVLKLRPSSLAKYFENPCDRRLVERWTDPDAPGGENDTTAPENDDGFAAAAGNQWEDDVVRYLKARFGCASTQAGSAPELLRKLFWNPDDSGKNKCSAVGGAEATGGVIFLHHPAITLSADTRELLPVIGTEPLLIPSGVYWSRIEPDLICLQPAEDDVMELTVIDVKLAHTPHVSHIMQVSLYLSLLETYLSVRCVRQAESARGPVWRFGAMKLRVNRDRACIWTGREALKDAVRQGTDLSLDDLSDFRPAHTQRFLNDFFREDLPRIRRGLPDDPRALDDDALRSRFLCMGLHCAGCAHRESCLKWAREDKSVQAYPTLGGNAQQYLLSYVRKYCNCMDETARALLSLSGINNAMYDQVTLVEVHKVPLAYRNYHNHLDVNHAFNYYRMVHDPCISFASGEALEYSLLQMQEDHLERIASEERRTAWRLNDIRSLQIPKTQDVALMLTLHAGLDRNGELQYYAWGIGAAVRDGLRIPGLPALPRTEVCNRLESGPCGAHFLTALDEILRTVDRFNRTNNAAVTLKAYVLDYGEFENIRKLLLSYLDGDSDENANLRDTVQRLLFWLMGCGIDGAASRLELFPERLDSFPVVALGGELRNTFFFPGEIFVTLPEMADALGLAGENAARVSDDYAVLCAPFSDQISPENVFTDQGDRVFDLSGFLERKLALQLQLLALVQADCCAGDHLNQAELPAFSLPEASGITDPALAKLLFRAVNEQHLRKLEFAGRLQNPSRSASIGRLMMLDSECIRLTDNENDHRTIAACSAKWTGDLRNLFESPTLKRLDSGGDIGFTISWPRGADLRSTPDVKKDLTFAIEPPAYLSDPEKERLLSLGVLWLFSGRWRYSINTEEFALENVTVNEKTRTRVSCTLSGKGVPLPRKFHVFSVREGRFEKPEFHFSWTEDTDLINPVNGNRIVSFYVSVPRTGDTLTEEEKQRFRALGRLALYDSRAEQLLESEQAVLKTMAAAEMPAMQLFRSEPHRLLENNGSCPGADYGALSEMIGGGSVATRFKPSQAEAFAHVVSDRFTVLQGPPGTGKSDFIARTVIALARCWLEGTYRKPDFGDEAENRTLRILISANTHDAIDNALRKIRNKQKCPELSEEQRKRITIKKFGGETGERSGRWMGAPFYSGAGAETRSVAVVGATCWSCRYNTPEFLNRSNNAESTWWDDPARFDLIIIDEASQVSVSEALMIMAPSHAHTHFLVVGDQHQLSVINKGSYSVRGADDEAPPETDDALYSSVFDYCLEKIDGGLKLLENFRMNEAICHYSARQIYGPRFSGADPAIRTQELSLAPNWRNGLSREETFVLDAAHPLVLIVLRGEPAMLADLERKLALRYAFLLQTLAEGGIRKNGNVTSQSVQNYWNHNGHLGIVVPTNEQSGQLLQMIRNETKAYYRMEQAPTGADFCIGTVNRLQGQERDAVIISYGVTGAEQAVSLKDFYYDRRRFNVALTRARKKAIVILTGTLVDRPLELLCGGDEELLRALSFLCDMEGALGQPDDPNFAGETRSRPEYGYDGAFFTEQTKTEDPETGVRISMYAHGYRETSATGKT